uniref:Uncharacterized protein n=1 Tax=Nelumbo nucifera TaxID=4432 RepID=A0A822Y6B9_NELNU|nr:TPA_asm: hypothetical protein HUJ06_029041 [Nelumbo nucifera]
MKQKRCQHTQFKTETGPLSPSPKQTQQLQKNKNNRELAPTQSNPPDKSTTQHRKRKAMACLSKPN